MKRYPEKDRDRDSATTFFVKCSSFEVLYHHARGATRQNAPTRCIWPLDNVV